MIATNELTKKRKLIHIYILIMFELKWGVRKRLTADFTSNWFVILEDIFKNKYV